MTARTQIGAAWGATTQTGGSTTLAAPARTITAGSLVRGIVRGESSDATATVTDTAGGTWVVVKERDSNVTVWMAYSWDHPGGTNVVITATFTVSQSYRSCTFIEHTGGDSVDPYQSGSLAASNGVGAMDLSVPFTGDVSIFGGQGNYSSTSYTAVNGVIVGSTNYHAALLINSTSSSPGNPKITGSSGGVATIAAAFSDPVTGGPVTLTPPLLTRSKTIYAPTLTGGAVTAQAGLIFALNGAVGSMARIEWPSHTDAMALRKSSTFIYEYETDASQVGYGAQVWFSTEGWTGDGPGWNAGFHSAYPCNLAYDSNGQATGGTGSSGTTHAPEIAGLGSRDYIHTPTGSSGTAAASYKGTRRRAAVVLEDVGSDIRHTFYYNLPSTTDKIVIDFDQATLDGYSVADALLRVGSSPWTDNTPFSGRNEETANGLLRFFKVFDVPLSESDMLTEAATESNTPATTAGLASVYYTNINPTVADITDKSGAGNDPVWANAQRPDDWSAQVVTVPLLTRTKTIFVPSVSQEGVTLSPSLLTRTKTLYAPSVAVGTVNLTPPLLTRSKTIYAPVVSQAGAPQIVAPGLLTRTKVLYSPVVVPGEVDVAPPLLTRTKVLYSPTISTGYGITAPLLTRGKTIYAPTITVGGVTLTPPLLTRSKTIYFPTLTGGDTPVATGGVFWPTVRRRRR